MLHNDIIHDQNNVTFLSHKTQIHSLIFSVFFFCFFSYHAVHSITTKKSTESSEGKKCVLVQSPAFCYITNWLVWHPSSDQHFTKINLKNIKWCHGFQMLWLEHQRPWTFQPHLHIFLLCYSCKVSLQQPSASTLSDELTLGDASIEMRSG